MVAARPRSKVPTGRSILFFDALKRDRGKCINGSRTRGGNNHNFREISGLDH